MGNSIPFWQLLQLNVWCELAPTFWLHLFTGLAIGDEKCNLLVFGNGKLIEPNLCPESLRNFLKPMVFYIRGFTHFVTYTFCYPALACLLQFWNKNSGPHKELLIDALLFGDHRSNTWAREHFQFKRCKKCGLIYLMIINWSYGCIHDFIPCERDECSAYHSSVCFGEKSSTYFLCMWSACKLYIYRE